MDVAMSDDDYDYDTDDFDSGEEAGDGDWMGGVPPQKTVVVNIGSSTTRFGRASDKLPRVIPSVIAWRILDGADAPPSATSVPLARPLYLTSIGEGEPPRIDEATAEAWDDLEDLLLNERHRLIEGRSRYKQLPAEPRGKAKVASAPSSSLSYKYTDLDAPEIANAAVLFGEEALRLPPKAPFIVHQLVTRGRLNRSDGLEVTRRNLEVFLQHLVGLLGVGEEDMSTTKVVILMNDDFIREDVKLYHDVVLGSLGAESVLTCVESLGIGFAYGASTAVVVALGAEMSSVVVLEDMKPLTKARIVLNYGTRDLEQLLLRLVLEGGWPDFASCGLSSPDPNQLLAIMEKLRRENCHLICEREKPVEVTFHVTSAADDELQPGVSVLMHAQDSLIRTPLAVFYPGVLHLLRREAAPFDDEIELCDEDYFTTNRTELVKAAAVRLRQTTMAPEAVPSLDAAIVECIGSCGRMDTKRRSMCNVLVTGTGASVPGLREALQARLTHLVPTEWGCEKIVVREEARWSDPTIVAWKGGAVLSIMPASANFFITAAAYFDPISGGSQLLCVRTLYKY